ncbi:MAG: recombination mediator RecR [Planctomycetota bacterium]
MSDAPKPSPSRSGGPRESAAYPEPVDRLIAELAALPGIGRRSAERLAFHLLKAKQDDALALARAVHDVKKMVRHCAVCFNFADDERCRVCLDDRRDRGLVLVVEQPKDLIALEQTGQYRGLYHVLMGRLSPLDGIGPESITASQLLDRVDDPERNAGDEPVREVILGMNPTLEGDGTSLYLADELSRRSVRVTRLARGLPSGSPIEYASKAVLADAIEGRRQVD